MAPLQGFTLGERQKFYNQLVKEQQIVKKTPDLSKICFEDDDVDNMIKIDIACSERNVDYILDVFKCEDMLYVSRAINKSTWLITDPQYAHIINPKYLHGKLFPQMNAKAVTKFMLHIRRYLKNEVRVKAFYNYVCQTNPKAALHWLENCSLNFIEKVVSTRAHDIPVKLLKRLCRKSINILRVFVKTHHEQSNYYSKDIFEQIKYYLKRKDTSEQFLDILESLKHGTYIQFNEKYTHILMKRCPKRIKENIHIFHRYIDLTTFVKYIKTDEIRPFLTKNHSYSSWINFQTLTPFLVKLPREEVLDFISTLYGTHDHSSESKNSNKTAESKVEALFYAIEGRQSTEFSNIYRWYQFVPFDLAFRDIKKFIFAESSAEERHSMLIVLLTCAKSNFDHVKTVLQYYHDKHINEPYVHKKTFIQSLLSQHDTFRFDDSTWNLLNTLFHSMEVYIDSSNEVQACLVSIIVHNVLRHLPVHEVVEEKFEIKSLKHIKDKLSLQEQDKLFNYLYNLSVGKVCKQKTNSETGMHEAIKLLKTIWTLLKDWNRVETHRRFVIDKVAEFGEINKTSSWSQEIEKARRKRRKKRPNRDWKLTWRHLRPKSEPYVNISSIYSMVNSYRKELFESSLVLHASEEVLLNALKHDPGLLVRYASEIDGFLRSNDEVSLNRFLSKLRIYWADSLAAEWAETNINYLKKSTSYRALVRGVLILLPRNKILDFIQSYVPSENKIQWSMTNEIELSMQKHIAKNMHIVRPQLPAEVVLWYAKGDYLQYALLSLNTMYYNLRSSDIQKYINIMLNAPVSLQKHGIRLAFVKFKTNEIIDLAPVLWKKTKNSSIRATLFTSMFKLLCKENKVMTIKAIWAVLSSYIDDLNEEENKVIYRTMGKVGKVPLIVVGDFFQKAYLSLKSFTEKFDLEHIIDCMIHNDAERFIEYLDFDFVEKSLLGSVYKMVEGCDSTYLKILSAYILCSKDLETQMKKYNNLLRPVIEKCKPKWENGKKDSLNGIREFLGHISRRIADFVFVRKMAMPVKILTDIQNALIHSLSVEEHYILIRQWQLATRYLEILVRLMEDSNEPYTWHSICTMSAPQIASMCLDFVVEDEKRLFPSIYLIFKDALQAFFEDFNIDKTNLLLVLETMLEWKDKPSMYLLVLEMIPPDSWDNEFERKKEPLKRKINFHPSKEVTMHYYRKYTDKFGNYENDDTEDSQEITDSEQESEDDESGSDSNDESELTEDEKPKNVPTFFGNICNII